MRQPRLGRDLAELRTDLSADLGFHQLTGNQRDRLPDEILKPTIAHLRDDIGNRHALTFGHRGVLLHVDCEQPTSSAPRWPTLAAVDLPGARYTTSTDVTRLVADPLIYMRRDGRSVLEVRRELVEVEYDAVLELRYLWHREDFGRSHRGRDLSDAGPRGRRTRRCARDRGDRRRLHDRNCPSGTHDGGSEISQEFVRPECRGAGLGGALTAQAIRVAGDAAPQVWICAERDNRPRRLYQRLGFRRVVETGIAILPPSDRPREPRPNCCPGALAGTELRLLFRRPLA